MIKLLELEDCKLTLALDRTNWKYGKEDINLLILSVCVLGCSLPIYWLELDSRGNSNTQERIELMDRFIAKFGTSRIDYLVADREFMGNDWFTYLNQNEINFAIRIKCNMMLGINGELNKARNVFGNVRQGGV